MILQALDKLHRDVSFVFVKFEKAGKIQSGVSFVIEKSLLCCGAISKKPRHHVNVVIENCACKRRPSSMNSNCDISRKWPSE